MREFKHAGPAGKGASEFNLVLDCMEKSLPWTESHLFPAESTAARSVNMNKPRADNSASACSDCLALTEMTRLDEPT